MLDIAALTSAVATFHDGDWSNDIIAYSTANNAVLSKPAQKFAKNKIDAEFERGHAGRAFNWAFLLVQFTKGDILEDVRFCELFRPTGHENRISKLNDVLKRLREQTRASGLAAASSTFESWRSFSVLFKQALEFENVILNKIRSTARALAWLVSYTEEIFAFEHELGHPPTLDKQHRFDLSKEETATAVSYLLGRYHHRWGLAARDFPTLPRPVKPPSEIADFLLHGYSLSEVRSLEPTVFRFGSRCTWLNKTTVEITHPNATVDISLELGYIKTHHAAMSPSNIVIDDRPSLKEICDRFQRDISSDFVTYASEGPLRLRIEIPQPVLQLLSRDVFLNPGFFAEELRELTSLCWELSTTPQELEAFQITPNLGLLDLLQIRRIFHLFASARNEHLQHLRDSDPACYWNSMLGGLSSKSELIQMLSKGGIPEQMADEYVNLFVWQPLDHRPLDLQYTSFLPFENRLAIPLNLHANSNGMRNALMFLRKRLYEDGTKDPLSANLEAALAARTPYACKELDYRWQQDEGNIDALALIDGCAYVFECKNTLLPCSAFERRTLWDHLQKAVAQLDRIRELWQSADFRAYLTRKLGWQIPLGATLATCIVPSVRLFSGAHLQGHPVRHSRELINMLGNGKGALSSASRQVLELNLWRTPEFSRAILDEYLSEDSALYQAHWSAMSQQWEPFKIGTYTAKNRRYVLDIIKLEHELRTRGFVVT